MFWLRSRPFKMNFFPPPIANPHDGDLTDSGASTAPSTPEGSLTFSPVLRARVGSHSEIESSSLVGQTPQATAATAASNTRPLRVRNICCVGAGYVGGPTAAVIAYQNPQIRVTVVDRDEKRIIRWNSKHLPIYEPGLGDIVRVARDGSREFSFLNEPANRTQSDVLSETTSSSEFSAQSDGHANGLKTIPARTPNLFFSTDVARCIGEADVVLVAVNTPTKAKGMGAGSATDMTAFEAVTGVVAQHARPGAIIVEKSTVPCRTAQLVKDTMSIHRPGVHFEILSNPEFLAAGTAMKDLMRPDRVLIGSSTTSSGKRAAEALAEVYAAWVPRKRILTTNVWSSELAKLVANSMLAQRISSINSISAICEKTGADVDEVAASIGCDPRIGDKFLKAGIGFGGSCFKKDVLSLVYLAESLGLEEVGEYWRQVIKMNEYQRDRFSRRVIKCLNNTLTGKKITVLGYAFKANTSDTRESPALEIIKTLLEEGPKEIALFDPCCSPAVIRDEINTLLKGYKALREDGGPVVVYGDAYQACAASNAVLIATEFDEFRMNTSKPASIARPHVGSVDPRPFHLNGPTETEILALHEYLLESGSCSAEPNPLHRYLPEPSCADDCPDCGPGQGGYSTAGSSTEHKPKEKLDWSKIAYHLQKPKWVFDGRGVTNVDTLNRLGVSVENVGRQGRA